MAYYLMMIFALIGIFAILHLRRRQSRPIPRKSGEPQSAAPTTPPREAEPQSPPWTRQDVIALVGLIVSIVGLILSFVTAK